RASTTGDGRTSLLAALLDVALDELLGVLLEHLVDLVEQVVELGLQLLTALGGRGDLHLGLGVLLGSGTLLALLFGHRGIPPDSQTTRRAGPPGRQGSRSHRTTLRRGP